MLLINSVHPLPTLEHMISIHILNHRDSESALVYIIHSHLTVCLEFPLDASYEAK